MHKVIIIIVMFFLTVLLFVKSYHLAYQFWKLGYNTSSSHEAVNLVDHKQCLDNIPVENSVIFTNSFKYPAENYRRDDFALQLTAPLGHQAYASNFAYERYKLVNDRIELQKEVLAWNDMSLIKICALLKDKNSFIFVDKLFPYPDILNTMFVYSNNNCGVFKKNTSICNL
jgi:hypothetical protein